MFSEIRLSNAQYAWSWIQPGGPTTTLCHVCLPVRLRSSAPPGLQVKAWRRKTIKNLFIELLKIGINHSVFLFGVYFHWVLDRAIQTADLFVCRQCEHSSRLRQLSAWSTAPGRRSNVDQMAWAACDNPAILKEIGNQFLSSLKIILPFFLHSCLSEGRPEDR